MTRLADLIADARRSHRQFALGAIDDEPRSDEDAYRVQDEVARELGWFASERPRVWKCGAPNRQATPVAAPLPGSLVVASPAQFSAGVFNTIGIEAEIALRFKTAVVDVPRDWSTVIGELVVTIEVVDSRIADVAKAGALVKLADLQTNGALVVGDAIPYRDVDWSALRAVVRRNGAVLADTIGGHSLRDPTWLLPWFVRHVAERAGGVRAGDLVTLGTFVGLLAAVPGDSIDASFDGIGSVAARFG